MKFDRARFFEEYRKQFGSLEQFQVDGLNAMLHNYETYHGWWDSVPQIANSLYQVKHESAHSFQPVVEGFYLDPSLKAVNAIRYYQGDSDRVRRFQNTLRYDPWFGRGHIQLTWEENYVKLDKLIRQYFPEIVAQFELRNGRPFNLAKRPQDALDFDTSFAIMTIGMHKGVFRAGHTLDRYINAAESDYFNARDIVNGDKRYKVKGTIMTMGQQIAEGSKRMERILTVSLLAQVTDRLSTSISIPAISAQSEQSTEPENLLDLTEPSPPVDYGIGTQAAAPEEPVQPEPAPSNQDQVTETTTVTEQIEQVDGVEVKTTETVQEQSKDPVIVQQMIPEQTEAKPEPTGIKALIATVLGVVSSVGGGFLSLFQGLNSNITIGFFVSATVIGVAFIFSRYKAGENKQQREHELMKLREEQTYNLQVIVANAAASKEQNTIKIVPQPIRNSEAPREV